jgi:hypothetical protein
MGGRQGRKTVRGGVGEQIFREVEQLTSDGRTTRLAAFRAIADRTGRKVGTVTANYYRIARKRGVPLRARKGRGPGRGRTKSAIAAIDGTLRALASVLRAQAQELTALRKENQRFEQVRRLLKP